MTYLVYVLFAIWLLSGLGSLLSASLIKFGPPNAARLSNLPAWYLFVSGLYTLAIVAFVFWFYRAGSITEGWVFLILGVCAIPELLSRLVLWRKNKKKQV